MYKYTTVQGDTWDIIAYKMTGSVYNMSDIMLANKDYLNVRQFSGGIILNIPKDLKDKSIIEISNPYN